MVYFGLLVINLIGIFDYSPMYSHNGCNILVTYQQKKNLCIGTTNLNCRRLTLKPLLSENVFSLS